jgi:hypothetical protein
MVSNVDPDPALNLNVDPDPGSRTKADPFGSGSWSFESQQLLGPFKALLLT